MTFTYKIPCLDLKQTAGSGQVFRMIPSDKTTNTWQVISHGHFCFIRQENNTFFWNANQILRISGRTILIWIQIMRK